MRAPDPDVYRLSLFREIAFFLVLDAIAIATLPREWTWSQILFFAFFAGSPLWFILTQICRVSFSPDGQITLAKPFRSRTFPASDVISVIVTRGARGRGRYYELSTRHGAFTIDSRMDWKVRLLARLEEAARQNGPGPGTGPS